MPAPQFVRLESGADAQPRKVEQDLPLKRKVRVATSRQGPIYLAHDHAIAAAAAGAAPPLPWAVLRSLPKRDVAPTPRLAGTGRGGSADHGTAEGRLRRLQAQAH